MKKYISIICAIILTAICICGCGSNQSMVYETAAAADYWNEGAMAKEAPMAAVEEAAYEGDYGAAMASGGTMQEAGEVTQPQNGRKLIKNVNLNLETKTFDQTIAEITNKVNALGGYVQSNDIYLPQSENQRGSA